MACLAPYDLLTDDLLVRSIPALAPRWDSLRALMESALKQVGRRLLPDHEHEVLPLLSERVHLRTGIDRYMDDLAAMFRVEVWQFRLLMREDEQVLGRWLSEARLVEMVITEIGNSTRRDILPDVYQRLVACFDDVRSLCPPAHSVSGWRAALLAAGYRIPTAEEVMALAAECDVEVESMRARLATGAALCRLLPDAALSHLAAGLVCDGAPPPGSPPGVTLDPETITARGVAARQVMFHHNLRLVLHIARSYSHAMGLADVGQEGAIGLLFAIKKFDYYKGNKFSTYASWWIRQAISRAVSDKAHLVRLPVHMWERVQPLLRETRWWPATGEERVELLKCGDVDPIIALNVAAVYHPEPLDPDNLTAECDVVDKQLESEMDDIGMYEVISDAIAALTERERQVLILRFGLDRGMKRTLEEVGQKFGVTRERIRQIEEKALRRMRHPVRARRLREYAELPPPKKLTVRRSSIEDIRVLDAKIPWAERIGWLPSHERSVMIRYLGIQGDGITDPTEIAHAIGLEPEEVMQIINSAFNRIRRILRESEEEKR